MSLGETRQHEVCTAYCCTEFAGCDDVSPVDAGCYDDAVHRSDRPILDDGGGHVGMVSLLWSDKCQAWWTETWRYPSGWEDPAWEITASFEGEPVTPRCTEAVEPDTIHDDGVTTYGCGIPASEYDYIYNRTLGWNPNIGSPPRACGWLGLKPADGTGGPQYFGSCGGFWGDACESNRPPDCSQAMPSAARVFPEDHAQVTICVDGISDPDDNHYVPADDPGTVNMSINAVSSSEVVDGIADGNFTPDTWTSPYTGETNCAMVRAERQGSNASGRIYDIDFTVTDTCGALCIGSVSVHVPHDHRDE
jgi:hypothetical protein